MKHIIYTIGFLLVINSGVNAQTKNPSIEIKDFAAKIENSNLLINWNSSAEGQDNYWEVQGSKDGKTFSTIGIVLGADPAEGGFKYKQSIAKVKPGLKYYRVLHVESDEKATASNTIGVSK
ncbi:MAG: hypothetical protein ABI091_18775 [Ferruginibacter sp.]